MASTASQTDETCKPEVGLISLPFHQWIAKWLV